MCAEEKKKGSSNKIYTNTDDESPETNLQNGTYKLFLFVYTPKRLKKQWEGEKGVYFQEQLHNLRGRKKTA